jgi:hypothetical protein
MWHQTGSFRGNGSGSISGVSFDVFEERLWYTDTEGYLSSQSLPVSTPPLAALTSTRSCIPADHNNVAWGITNINKLSLRPSSCASGTATPIGCALRLYSREGLLTADIPVSSLKNSFQSSLSSVSSPIANNREEDKSPQTDESILCSLGIDTNEHDPSIGSFNVDQSWRTSKLLVGGRLPSLYVLDSTKLFSQRDQVYAGKSAGIGSPGAFSSSLSDVYNGEGNESIWPLRALQKQPVRILTTLQMSHPVMHLCYSENRSILAANGEGPHVSLFDGLFRSTAPTGSLSSCHAGGIRSIDSSHYLIVTCGNTSINSNGSIRNTSTTSYSHTQAMHAKGKGGFKEGVVIDPLVKIYDSRMIGRVVNSFSVPIGNGLIGSGPIYVKFMPNVQEVIYNASSSLLIGTSDGRFFVLQDASSNRRLDPLAQIDLSTSAMLRDENLISRDDSNYPRITCITLSSSGLAIAAGDAEGTCHVISPVAGAITSRLGAGNFICQPGVRYHGANEWITSTGLSREDLGDATITESAVSNCSRNFENSGVRSGPIHLATGGNAGTFNELKFDSCVDAALLQGIGYDVPVAAPGLGLLSPKRDSWAVHGKNDRWNKLWSVPLGAMQGKSVIEMLKYSPLYSMGESDENNTHVFFSQQLQHHQRVVPGLYLASTLPEWTNNTIMAPPRRKIIDPLLLQMAAKQSSTANNTPSSTLSYVNNRMPSTGLRPNSLIFGKRRGNISSDPRKKAEKSSFSSIDSNGKVRITEGGRVRGSSIDSLSTTGSLEELKDVDGIGDELDDIVDGDDYDEEEVEGVLVLIEGTNSASASIFPPQAYSRPRIKLNPMFGYDVDFSVYNHCPPTLGPFTGFEEVGPNSFVNAVLHMLFFCTSIRARIQRHICSAPACVACELRFVFDALCQAPIIAPDARVTSAQPLLRVLHNVTEVSRLGLLHPCTIDPPKRMEMFIKVLLEKISRETQYLSALQYKEVKDGNVLNLNSSSGGTDKTSDFLIPTPWDSELSSKAVESAVARGVPPHLTNVAGNVSVDDLISFRTKNVTTCSLKGHESARDGSMKMVELVYPDSSVSTPSFSSLLSAALNTTRNIPRAWCDDCSSYTPHKESRRVCEIGDLFFVSTGLASHTVAQQQKDVLTAELKASNSLAPSKIVSETTTGNVATVETPLAYARQLWAESRSKKWLPTFLKITSGRNHSSTSFPEAESAPVCATDVLSEPTLTDSDDVFSLVGVIMHVAQTSRQSTSMRTSSTNSTSPHTTLITDESTALKKYHFTSCLKLRNDGAYGPSGSDHSSWVIFNHFRITPATEGEVLNFSSSWKTPCVLLYQRLTPRHPHPLYIARNLSLTKTELSQLQMRVIAKRRQEMGFVHFTNAESISNLVNILHSSTLPSNQPNQQTSNDAVDKAQYHLMLSDLVRIPPSVFAVPLAIPHQPLIGSAPNSGTSGIPVELSITGSNRENDLVAIDAEFVIVSSERSKILPDGSKRVIIPARSMPGRVSIIRADGSVLLDSYLCAAEKVVDHLTRFSGIYEGDLDPKTSSYRLLTQKEMYIRIRALIDNGIKFVGHGLRKDCRELNIVIPKHQTIDTVRLYQLPSQRFLSLKFLTSHVLNASIQASVHDSCEDAHFSMQLYQKYLSLKGKHSSSGTPVSSNPAEAIEVSKDEEKHQKGGDDFDVLLQKLYEQGRSSGWRAKVISSNGSNLPTADLPPLPPVTK